MFKISKYIFITLLLFSWIFYSCDPIFSLLVNNEKKYVLDCKENQVEFQAKFISAGGSYKVLIKPMKGNINIHTDSIYLTKYNDIDARFIHFKYSKEYITGHHVIEQGKTLICSFSLWPWEKPILIPPSNFIMCDGKPLITDTIRISMK
jgi:hypothetical protein